MPSDAATLMSTAARMAATPSRICSISLSSGPRTAATMQNSLAPVAAVCLAARTSSGTLSHTERTGLVNWPDCEQKWQSSGQPPVLSDTMPSTSTLGPWYFIRTSWASARRSCSRSSPVRSTSTTCAWVSGTPRSSTCSRATSRMSVPVTCAVMALIVAYAGCAPASASRPPVPRWRRRP